MILLLFSGIKLGVNPLIVSGDPTSDCDEVLVVGLRVRGVWSAQSEALFDIRISDTAAQSYLSYTPETVLFRVEVEKKTKIFCSITCSPCSLYTTMLFH